MSLMNRSRAGGLAAAFLCVSSVPAHAESRSFSWSDPNYVPCEGLGVLGSGRIDLTAQFASAGDTVTVTQIMVRTQYQFAHEPSGALDYEDPRQGSRTVSLTPPSGPTIGAAGSNDRVLLLPGRNGRADPPLSVRAGSRLRLSISTVFPQTGGACVASFDETFSLP